MGAGIGENIGSWVEGWSGFKARVVDGLLGSDGGAL
jgi:hypothetical protein